MPAVASGRRAHVSLSSVRCWRPEELLLDDVRDLADAALEDRAQLEERRLHLAVAVAPGEVAGDPLEARVGGPFGGQEVARPTGRSELGHAAQSSGRAAAAARLSRGRAGR